MRVVRFFLLQIHGLFPFLYPLMHIWKRFHFFRGIISYYKDYFSYMKLQRRIKSPFAIKLFNAYPIYFDRYEDAGEIPRHYFFQDLWAAKRIHKSGVKIHYDIGSRIDSFISHCLVFCKVVMLDIRPLNTKVPGLHFIQTDAMNMKNIHSRSIKSLSSLHAIEHFGLGRYGDPIDPLGYEKAIHEIKRIMNFGGNIYFSMPIGKQRLEFNGHRVFNPLYIIKLFSGFELVEFSAVNDNNEYKERVNPRHYVNATYSCGLFHFRKKRYVEFNK